MNHNAGILHTFKHVSTTDDIVRLELNIDTMMGVEFALFQSSERVIKLKDYYVERVGGEHLDFCTLDVIAPLSYWANFCARFHGEELVFEMEEFFRETLKSEWYYLGMA